MTKHPVDVHVGQRIRHRRWLVGATQQQLAAQCSVKFQQIQKYESGTNRVSASRLWKIAKALGVPVSYFFEGLEGGAGEAEELADKADFALAADLNHLAIWHPETHAAVKALVKSMAPRELAGNTRQNPGTAFGNLCPVCGGSGRTLKSGHPFKTRPCWMCAGRMYFGPRWYEEGR